MLILVCMAFVGDPTKGWAYNQWCAEHSVTAQKFFSALEKNDILAILNMTFQATAAQLGPFGFVFDTMFWWIFASVVEKKLLSWRFPAFLLIGMVGSWTILVYEVGFLAPSQRFISPIMFLCYVMGAFLIFKPRKPFKPAEWKPLPWKVFKGDEHTQEKKLKVPWVSPWVYIGLFVAYAAAIHFLATMSSKELIDITHVGLVGNIRQWIMGSISPGTIQVVRPIPGVEAMLLGVFSAYILQNIVFKSKLRREAGDMQVQAILQYKELRALDMNHKQAVEGTSKLIGVPLDIVKDWIAKGLQTPPSDSN